MSESTVKTIRSELRTLLRWFPGPGVLSWVQVLIVPALLAFAYHQLFTVVLSAQWEPEGIPPRSDGLFASMVVVALPVPWMLYIGAFTLLARGYRSRPDSAPDTIALLGSSWIYAILVSSGFVVVACLHTLLHGVAIDGESILYVAAAVVAGAGELAIVLAILALAVRYVPFLLPALAVGVVVYAHMLPVYYAREMIELSEIEAARTFFTIAPLAEVIDAFRDALLRNAPITNLLTAPRILLPIAGYGGMLLAIRYASRSRLSA